MNHEDFQDDQYSLYSLGLLEEPEKERLQSHVAQGCEVCAQSLKNSRGLWYLFGSQTEQLQGVPKAGPPGHLRSRIVNSVSPAKPSSLLPFVWSWSQAAAGLLVLTAVAGVTWYASSTRSSGVSRVVVSDPAEVAQNRQLKQENQDLQGSLEQLRKMLAEGRANQKIPTIADPNGTRSLEALSQEAVNARRASEQLTATIAAEKAHAAQVELELSHQQAQVASLIKERDGLTARNVALEDGLRKSAELERRLVDSSLKIRDLERNVQQYQRTIELQRVRLEADTHLLASFSSPSLQVVRLAATEAARGADGHVVIADGKLLLYTSNLPALPPDRVYQLWLIRDRNPGIASGGTFARGAGPNGLSIQLEDPSVVSNIRAIAISEEPAGGSKLPSGHKILIGTAKS